MYATARLVAYGAARCPLISGQRMEGVTMLVVCNGAPKSGSTWLYNIVERLYDFDWPAEEYRTSTKKHPTIRPDALEAYLKTDEYQSKRVITKTHYGSERLRDSLLSNPQTRVLDMKRGLYDVIVSSYYDSCRREGFQGDFSKFYWFEGRSLAQYLIQYHKLWEIGHPHVYVTSFEALKTDFEKEARRIAAFLDKSLSDEDVARIREETDITSLRQNYQDDPQYNDEKNPFFRKGIVGDWESHFEPSMLKDIEEIEQSGIGSFDLVELSNKIKKKLFSRFPSLSPYQKI